MIDEIGQKIRNLRSASELTQSELARRAGLTDGFISQVERSLTSISIDSLKMILGALNISLAEFFKEEKPARLVFGADDQVEIDEGGTGRLFLLVPGATNRNMEPALLRLPENSATSIQPSFQGDVYGYILKGRVKITYSADTYIARVGESFYFSAECEYRIANPNRREAIVLWITSPPYF